jgi:hypothetical protein
VGEHRVDYIDSEQKRLCREERFRRLTYLGAASALLSYAVLLMLQVAESRRAHKDLAELTLAVAGIKIPDGNFSLVQFRSGVFAPGEYECSSHDAPCATWWRLEDKKTATAVDLTGILKGLSQGPLVVLVQGEHDSRRLSPQLRRTLRSNQQLAQLRADSVSDLLHSHMPSTLAKNSVVISTARAADSLLPPSDTNRTVTVTFVEFKR